MAAALRQLEATGSPDRVTIAAVVEEAGCTPPSLYHYWPRRELLLQEASARGWAHFRAGQTSAVADSNDPVERLRLRGRAYLEFALAKPTLFRVLFLEPPTTGPTQTTPATRPTPTSQPGRPGQPAQPAQSTQPTHPLPRQAKPSTTWSATCPRPWPPEPSVPPTR